MTAATLDPRHESIRRAVSCIVGRLDAPPTLDELAEASGYSPFHFHRVFRHFTAEGVAGLTRRLRLERAAIALLRSERSVIDVGLEAGYDSNEAFTRASRAAYNMTPSDYRRARPHVTALPAPAGVHYHPAGRFDFQPVLDKETNVQIRIETWPETPIAYVRGVGHYPRVIPESFKVLGAFADRHGLWSAPGSTTLCVTHDNPDETPEDELRSDAAIIVPPGFASDDPAVQVRAMPGGKYAVATYLGPYSGLVDAWADVCSRLTPANGYRVRASECFEVYVNDCAKVGPDELRTDIYVPVE
jgi:AraC family transcriptional regulator